MYNELTKVDIKKMNDEINYRANELRPQLADDVKEARSLGDLSENAEYDAAKEEQGKIHARIQELREMIANAKVVDESQIDESKVSVGSIVVLYNVERAREFTYHIVGSYETDPANGKISDDSPVGKALIGAAAGDEVVVAGVREQHLQVKSVTRARDQH